ncbi:MAG: hypothetical protein ABSA47_07085 [Verrucomicrobiota bacterium]|jgi:hypothetical protein
MIINASLPAESAAASPRHSRTATASPSNAASPKTAPDTTLDRMRELSPAGQEEDWSGLDSAAADTWTSFLHSNILSQAGSALAAQANLNPETAFTLLR